MIALWDRLAWNPLGSGVDWQVEDFAVYEGDLYVGGSFTSAGGKPSYYIARWQDVLSGAPDELGGDPDLELIPSSPNPFSGATRLSYSLPRSSRVVLGIHDVRGRLVRTLHVGQQRAGDHSAVWDGTDASGVQAAPGIYFARLQAGNETKTCRMVLVR